MPWLSPGHNLPSLLTRQTIRKPLIQTCNIKHRPWPSSHDKVGQVNPCLPQLLSPCRDISTTATKGSRNRSLIATTLVSIHPSIDKTSSVNSCHFFFPFVGVAVPLRQSYVPRQYLLRNHYPSVLRFSMLPLLRTLTDTFGYTVIFF